jgi:hypothetical protein
MATQTICWYFKISYFLSKKFVQKNLKKFFKIPFNGFKKLAFTPIQKLAIEKKWLF